MKKLLFLIIAIYSANLLAQIPTAGLLAHYPFNGNANDMSGNLNHGTNMGATLTADRNGIPNSAYSFNGSTNYISLPAVPFTTLNLYTYSCWIKPTNYQVGFPLSFGESTYGRSQALVYQATGSVSASSYNQGSNPTQSYIHSPNLYPLNQWIHVAMTRDFTSIKMYINGILYSSTTGNTNGQNADYGFNIPIRAFIGARTLFNSYFFGEIDDVRIYNNALTQTDITALYNETCIQSISTSYSVCSGNTATLTAVPAPSNTISWYATPTASNPVGTGTVFTTPSLNSAGTLTYYAAASTCSSISQRVPVTITVNLTPTVTVPSASICSGGLFGINASGAFSYTYSGGQVVAPMVTTVYTVTGSNFQGCVSDPATVTVTVNQTPTITINSGFICSGDSFTLMPTGGTSYTYSGGSAVVSPLFNTLYTVTGTTGNGCYSSTVANVAVIANPTLAVTNPGNVCTGSIVTLSVSGANYYNWSTGATVAAIAVSPLSNTVYTVSGGNLFGCSDTKTLAVSVNPLPVISVNSGSICSGKSFIMSPTGASTYTYSSGTNVVSPLSNSSYSVTGTSALGCLSSNTAVSNVTVAALPSISVNSGSVCAGSSFTMIPLGGISYTYSGGGSAVVSPVATSNYTVTGAGVNGCTATAVSNVAAVALPVVSITGSAAVCNGGSVVLTANGANSYSWNTGPSTSTLSVTPAGTTTYSVTGLALSGCSNTANKVITVNSLPVVSVNSGSICSGRSFTMVAGGASTYTYSSGTNIVSPLISTSYSVTGTSAQGCLSSNTAVSDVTVIISPVISVNSGSVCAGKSFTMIPTGGISYTYTGGSAVVSPVATTQYTVTGANASGCTSTAVSTLVVNALPGVSITGTNAICNGSTALLTANGAASYAWSTGPLTSTISVSPSTTTSYSVTGLAANSCTNSASFNLTVNALPLVSVNSGTVCAGNAFTMTASGASTYTYSSGGNIVSPLSNSSYSVTGTSALGCLSSNTAVSNVTVIALSLVTVNSGSLCAGTVFTMTPSGALSYTYSNGSSTVIPTANTSYSVRGTNAQGCVSAPAIANVTLVALPVVAVNSGSICTGGVFTIVPSGAVSYSITGGSNTVSPSATTSYTVRGENAAGCISPVVVSNVTVNALPLISVNSGSVCSGKTFTMVPTGAASYTYSNGSNTVIPTANTSYTINGMSAQGCPSSNSVVSSVTVIALPVITVNSGSVCAGSVFTMVPTGASSYTYSSGTSTTLPNGNTSYTVTGTSAVGCISSPVVSQVTVNALPGLSITGTTVLCSGESTILNLNGAPSYTWINNNVTNSSIGITPLSSTIYTAIGQSAAGCTNTITQAITVNTVPVISASNASICIGNSYTITAFGASSYTYSSGSPVVNPAATTNYTITGASPAGCISTKTIAVAVNPLPVISISGQNTICAGQTATLNASGGTGYVWSTSTSGSVLAVSPAITTTYNVLGTDANSCSSTQTIEVYVNALPTLTINSGAICPGNSFTFSPSGAVSYTYSSGSNIISPLSTANYSVTGTDANGCVSVPPAVATVSVVNTLTVTITGNTTICDGEFANLMANGASNYVWNTGQLTNTIAANPSTTTTYTVMGSSGTCSDVAVVSVSVNPSPTVTVNSGSVCAGNSFTLIPAGALTYVYSGGAVVTPNSNSTYTVIGTDANNCSGTAVSSVNVFMLPIVSVASSAPGDLCAGESAFLTGIGATSYSWNTGEASSTLNITPSVTTTYTLTGTSTDGCSSMATITQNVYTCVGIEKLSTASALLEIYPNPTNGKFFIDYQSQKQASMIIENIEGKMIFSSNLNNNSKTEINVDLKPGIYFCRIISDGNSVAVKKLVITN